MLRSVIILMFCFSMLSCSSKIGKDASAGKIQSAVSKGEDVYYEDNTITDDLSLVDADEAAKISPTQFTLYIKGAMVFKNCKFKGKVIGSIIDSARHTFSVTFMKNIYFENCTFEDDVNLQGATVYGACNFFNCTFKKLASFDRVNFNQTAAFVKSQFESNASFQECTFSNSAFYNSAHFSQAVSFQNSFFYRELTFNQAICEGYADFSSITFYSNLYCNYSQFRKDAVFTGGNFKGRTEFANSKFQKAEFEACLFYGDASFEKASFDDMFSLKGSKFFFGKPRTTGYKAGQTNVDGVEAAGLGKLNDF